MPDVLLHYDKLLPFQPFSRKRVKMTRKEIHRFQVMTRMMLGALAAVATTTTAVLLLLGRRGSSFMERGEEPNDLDQSAGPSSPKDPGGPGPIPVSIYSSSEVKDSGQMDLDASDDPRSSLLPQTPRDQGTDEENMRGNQDKARGKMATIIFNLLERHRLESYYNQFVQFGVKDERDFIDGVTEEDLSNMGFTQVEKNRFLKMRDEIVRFRAAEDPMQVVKKSMEPFCIKYRYPHCPEPKSIVDMDPEQNTVEDLMLRICYLENAGNSKGVCLYTADGMPLTDDPYFNTWSLKDRHIENGAELYAIFTPKQNLKQSPVMQGTDTPQALGGGGGDTVRCHVMLKGNFETKVDFETDTINTLRLKLATESGIPAHILHYRGEHTSGETLQSCGISEESMVYFTLSSFCDEAPESNAVFISDVVPSVQQTQKGLSVFFSSLYAIRMRDSGEGFKKVLAYIRRLTGCNPLAQSLYQLLCRNEACSVTRTQKIAIVEGLYTLFRELLPRLGENRGTQTIEDLDVFENSTLCWAYLISEAEKETSEHENYAPMDLKSEEGVRFSDPVKVPGVPGVFERSYVLQKIQDGEKLPNCSEDNLRVTSLKKAKDIEKILLSLPPFIRTYQLWIDDVPGQNFQIDIKKTYGSMAEGLKEFPHLRVTPPLLLKLIGLDGPRLVLLSEDELGVYLGKDKESPEMTKVLSCLSGDVTTVDVNKLAAKTGDNRGDHTFVTSRTPKEAILVLVDASGSMAWNCYGSVDIKRIDAVKVLFDNFATRTMAYDFHHVIGLVKFAKRVETLHTFTETLEKFKDHIDSLQTTSGTSLYDALQHGVCELEKVKAKFTDCRLRIMCLTDGNDYGSKTKPVDVAVKLINANIIVDAILLGDVVNNMLHGISNATGGCCFKPKTSIDGMKLFEIETVLSLEMRKPKVKLHPSTLTESVLTDLFASRGYDEFPEASLPKELDNKVTMTQNALKKKIQECKSGRFMEKDKRIMEELKSLHCDPHPFVSIFPSESDFTFWKMAMEGPPDTPYKDGVFELYCQFGPDYPVKPPLVRFVTRIHHCNINSVGRICHNIFDRNYNAQITMREILDAIYGLLIIPEPEDPLDSVLAEDFLTSRDRYEQAAKENTKKNAGASIDDVEKKLVGQTVDETPQHLICPLTKKMFRDPVRTKYGDVYERKAVEKHLKIHGRQDPKVGKSRVLRRTDIKPDQDMKKMVKKHRCYQLETYV